MERLITSLSLINWTDSQWRKVAADILHGSGNLPDSLVTYMQSWDSRERSSMVHGCHETTTHYKWLIYRDSDGQFTIWFHQYKTADRRGLSYAAVPHNHRYDLCLIILSGGYDSSLYDVSGQVTEIGRERYRPGDILSLTNDQVHALVSICDGTKSLFIEGPTIRNFSTAFPLDGPPREHMDFDGRWDDTLESLKAISAWM